MPRQIVKTNQIKGIYGESLYDDINIMVDKAMNYDKPVQTVDDLPLTGNQEGDVRLVMGEGKFYKWDGTSWNPTKDIHTESRSLDVMITQDGQTKILINYPIGIVNGIASLNTIQLVVNGMLQKIGIDFSVSVENNIAVITWTSTDFQLETTDSVQVVYDILLDE
jgi:hypothetical protein